MKHTATLKPVRRHLQELRDWMHSRDCDQARLAELLEVHVSHVSQILKGTRNMSLQLALAAAVLTDIPIEKLCADRDVLRILKLYGERQNHAA